MTKELPASRCRSWEELSGEMGEALAVRVDPGPEQVTYISVRVGGSNSAKVDLDAGRVLQGKATGDADAVGQEVGEDNAANADVRRIRDGEVWR